MSQRHLRPLLVAASLLLNWGMLMAQGGTLPKEVQAVQKHILERDYPELFGTESYRTKIDDVLVTDLDHDGNKEVVVLFLPHYRQSAPIIIYRVSKDYEVTRVSEGLAPGPLVPVSDQYLDGHTLGQAVDFELGPKSGTNAREALLASVRKSGLGAIVEYKTFFHTDGRKGALAYIDMRNIDVPDGKTNCQGFEFSRVQSIGAGVLADDATKVYLAARVGPRVWLYQVQEFLADGLMQKTLRLEQTPEDFGHFTLSATGVLSYKTTAGDVRALKVK